MEHKDRPLSDLLVVIPIAVGCALGAGFLAIGLLKLIEVVFF